MKLRSSFPIKILALVSWWYIPVFILTLLALRFPESGILQIMAPEVRGGVYAWDFELLFTLIFAVWGVYLWRASKEPQKHLFFVQFTIWATIAHIVGMLVIGFLRPEEFIHLLLDASAFAVPLIFIIFAMKNEAKIGTKL